jgi:hypothetical protein
MRITIKLQIAGDDGTLLVEDDVLVLDKGHHHVEEIGLSLAETKDLLARLQKRLVSAQASWTVRRTSPLAPDLARVGAGFGRAGWLFRCRRASAPSERLG